MESKQPNTAPRDGRKGRWTALDTLIVLLLVACLAGIVYRAFKTVSAEDQKGPACKVYFEVEETHRDVLAEIRAFDAVYLLENHMRLGAMAASVIDPATGVAAPVLTPVYLEGTDLATASGCMVCRASVVRNDSILVEGTGRYLTRGSVLEIRTDRVVLTIRVTDIEVPSQSSKPIV